MKKTFLKYLGAFIFGLLFLFLTFTMTNYFKSKKIVLVDNFFDALMYIVVIIFFTALVNWTRVEKK